MIDLDSLLAPIQGELPQGVDLRRPADHASLLNLRDAWRTARARERPADGGGEAPKWDVVERQASRILAEQSKDLEVAVWLCEALVRTEGFAGLAAGGALIAGLAEQFWPMLYPSPPIDEPDLDADAARLQPLNQVTDTNGRLLPPIRRIELFTIEDGTMLSFFDCQQSKAWTVPRPPQPARSGGATPEQRAARELAAGARPWDAVRQAAQTGSAATLGALHHDVASALQTWRLAAQTVAGHVGEGKFFSAPLTGLLTDVLRLVQEVAPAAASTGAASTGAASTGVASTGAASTGDPAHDGEATPIASGPVGAPTPPVAAPPVLATREDALRHLADVTAFFQRTEPHSPLAHTLSEAIRRARLSWPELLAEVVPDRAQRDAIQHRLGIRPEAG